MVRMYRDQRDLEAMKKELYENAAFKQQQEEFRRNEAAAMERRLARKEQERQTMEIGWPAEKVWQASWIFGGFGACTIIAVTGVVVLLTTSNFPLFFSLVVGATLIWIFCTMMLSTYPLPSSGGCCLCDNDGSRGYLTIAMERYILPCCRARPNDGDDSDDKQQTPLRSGYIEI
jgi:hypothetical protein